MPSLQDYLSGADYDEAPAMAEGTSDAARKRLEDLLFSPDTPVPIPNTSAGSPGRERARTGLAALSDALHALSEAKGRSRGHPSVLDALQEERTRRAMIEAENQKTQQNAQTAARRGRAGYELGRLDRKEAESVKAAEEAKTKAERETSYYQRRAAELGIEGAANMPLEMLTDRVAKQEKDERETAAKYRDLDAKLKKRGVELEEVRTQVTVDAEKRKAEDEQPDKALEREGRKKLDGAKQGALNMKEAMDLYVRAMNGDTEAGQEAGADANMVKFMRKVKRDPESVRQNFLDSLDAITLTGKVREEAVKFFEEKVGPLIAAAKSGPDAGVKGLDIQSFGTSR